MYYIVLRTSTRISSISAHHPVLVYSISRRRVTSGAPPLEDICTLNAGFWIWILWIPWILEGSNFKPLELRRDLGRQLVGHADNGDTGA